MLKELIYKIKKLLSWEEYYYDIKYKNLLKRNHTTDTMFVFDPNRYELKRINKLTNEVESIDQ